MLPSLVDLLRRLDEIERVLFDTHKLAEQTVKDTAAIREYLSWLTKEGKSD